MSDWSTLSPDDYRTLTLRLGAPASPLPEAWPESESDEDEVLAVIDHATHSVNFEVRSPSGSSRGAGLLAADRMMAIAPAADGGAALAPYGSDQLLVWLGRQLDLPGGAEAAGTTAVVADCDLDDADRFITAGRVNEAIGLLVAGGAGADAATAFVAAWGARTRMGQVSVVRRTTTDGVGAASVELDWFESDGCLWAVGVPLPGRDGAVGAVQVSTVELLAAVAGNLAVLDWPGVPDLLMDDPAGAMPVG